MYRYINPLHLDVRPINRQDDDTNDVLYTIVLITLLILFILFMNENTLIVHPPMYKI
jgi:hypothetical protein